MRSWNLVRYVLISCAAGASLAACTLPFDSAQGKLAQGDTLPGAMPQTPVIASARNSAHRLSSSYQLLYRFHPRKDGIQPVAGLLDMNGTLYGTTSAGGLSHHGAVYSITTSGVEKLLYRFRGGSDGSDPQSGLLDVNGTLYGTTKQGGGTGCFYKLGCGTVYSVSTSGEEKVLHAFQGGSDGAHPYAGLIDVNGTLYGTTASGGGSGCYATDHSGCGTVFSITTSGAETVLHSFAGDPDGAYPSAELLDVKGVLYGTTSGGGSNSGYGSGTVYSITTAGVENVLYSFQGGSDGLFPDSGLIKVNGMLYGTTYQGGQNGPDCGGSCGTVFRVSTKGAEKVIYTFAGGSDGQWPESALIDVNGVLYGTTTYGGGGTPCYLYNGGCGTIYSVTTAGVETVLYRFPGGVGGWVPIAPLTNVNGTLYGTAELGGDGDRCCKLYGYGTVFTLTP